MVISCFFTNTENTKKRRIADFHPPHLPDEIIDKILLSLPADTLMRLRTLSKQWNNVIMRNHVFAEEHMVMHSNTRYVLQISKSHGYAFRSRIHSDFKYEVGAQAVMNNVRVELPFKKYIDESRWRAHGCTHWCEVSSSFHGLLCLIYHSILRATTKLFIWNPLTLHCKEIDWPYKGTVSWKYIFIGFGYDHVIKDYKIVVSENLHSRKASVMTLSTDKWLPIDAAPWQHYIKSNVFNSKQVSIGGDVSWLGEDQSDKSLVRMSFNLVEEKLTVTHIGRINDDDDHNVPAPTVGSTLGEPLGFDSEGNILMTVDNGRGLAAYLPKKKKLVNLKVGDQQVDQHSVYVTLDMESVLCP